VFFRKLLRREIVVWHARKHRAVLFVLLGMCIVVVCGVSAIAASAVDAGVIDTYIARRDHDAIVKAMEQQVGLIKLIGGAIVGSLVTATGLLYRALEKANAQSRNDLVEGIKRREKLVADMTESNTKVVSSNTEVTVAVQSLNAEVRDLVKEVRKT
jgi:hypothetical protein